MLNEIAIVTGGATGIGREIVKKLSQTMKVVINYNSSSEAANELVEEIKSIGGEIEAIQANITKAEEIENLFATVINKYGRIDVLVNNAGITSDNLIMRMSEKEFDDVINVNLKGTWLCSKYALKYMVKQKKGKIVNISSVSGIIGNAGQSNYSASKAGIIGLTKSLAREVAKRNITVNAVAPGFIKTKMTQNLGDDLMNTMCNAIPLGRVGDPKDVANVVSFLCSEEANYITGQVIKVDGGLSM